MCIRDSTIIARIDTNVISVNVTTNVSDMALLQELFFSDVQVKIKVKNNLSFKKGNHISKFYLKGFGFFWFPPSA